MNGVDRISEATLVFLRSAADREIDRAQRILDVANEDVRRVLALEQHGVQCPQSRTTALEVQRTAVADLADAVRVRVVCDTSADELYLALVGMLEEGRG